MSRTEQRKSYEIDVRLSLLEGDVDDLHAGVQAVRALLQRILTALITLTVTVMGSLITFIIVSRGGGN